MKELTHDRSANSLIQVRIVEDNERSVTAQLERDLLDMFTANRRTAHALTHRGGTRERDQTRGRVLHEVIANLRTSTNNNIEHACWQSSRLENLGQQETAGQRCVRCRLENHRVTATQCWRDRTHRERKREVPRANDTHHTQRFTENVVSFARGVGRQDLPSDAGRESSGLAQRADSQAGLDRRLERTRAGLRADQFDDRALVLLDPIRGPVEDRAAFLGRESGPLALGICRCLVGGIDVFLGSLTDGRDRFVIERVHGSGRTLGCSSAPTTDVEVFRDQISV